MQMKIDLDLLIDRTADKVVDKIIANNLLAKNSSEEELKKRAKIVLIETISKNSVSLENIIIDLTSEKLADETMLITKGIGAGLFNKM